MIIQSSMGSWDVISPDNQSRSLSDSSNNSPKDQSSWAMTVKLLFILIIFVISFGSGLAPLKFKRLKESTHLLGLANTFSGGVFLAIAFVHIIPETSNNYYISILENNDLLKNSKQP